MTHHGFFREVRCFHTENVDSSVVFSALLLFPLFIDKWIHFNRVSRAVLYKFHTILCLRLKTLFYYCTFLLNLFGFFSFKLYNSKKKQKYQYVDDDSTIVYSVFNPFYLFPTLHCGTNTFRFQVIQSPIRGDGKKCRV